ncbi:MULTISPECIES: Smr/MutS family protein [Rhodanobacter]|uniref:Smr/MutS family protein n=1 Tax=Rhodanobacter TaxID=75309 RepID=UPI000407DDC1|nr:MULTISPECIES: Smr/MutS family protein [Rhodanobacter]TAN17134.1 MAG: SMR domain protein [Rhodanobacter sp.]UJJ53739.1 Smr/MutS family protein [Rhodanobacter thiooxydans]
MKRRTPAPVNDDDSRLFREAIGDVRPLVSAPAPPAAPKPAPHPRMLEADEAAVPGELLDMAFDPALLEVGEELAYLRDGYPPKLLRQLKRGQFSVQDDLDLHQMNAAAAQASIAAFLAEAKQHGLRCVRIVHGKGLRSKAAGPVLKGLTDRLLRRRDDVIAFASARPAQGGTGAVIVLLKS